MDTSSGVGNSASSNKHKSSNQNIQVYVRVRPLNTRERCMRSAEVVDVVSAREIVARHTIESKLTKKFTFDRTFGQESRQVDVYSTVVAPLIEEVLSGYNCTVFAYGQTGTGKTHTMVGTESAELKSSWEDNSEIGIIPRALSHLFDELRLMALEFSMRISYLELYNEELCDLLSTDDSTKIRIFDDSTKKGSVIIQGLEEIPVHSKDDVYKLLEKGKERRKTATTLMNAQSSRSHTVFSILVHIRENGIDGEEMLKIGKLNLVDLAGSENVTKSGNEKGIRVRETVNINQSLLTLGRVITALVERTPHIPYRESKLTRLLQESLGGRTKTSIIATISPGHKDIEETLSTLEYAHRAKNIQNKPEVNQKLTKKTVLKEYTEEIDKLKRDLMAARDKNGIYLAEDTFNEMTLKMDSQNRELNEKMLLLKALKDELQNKEKVFNEVSSNLVEKAEELKRTEKNLTQTQSALLQTKKVLSNTKRRYKEKKVLLDSHVKTEAQLINQATKILEVADVATSDTHQLHNTIERRKDVDCRIQTACERFSERMRNNFKKVTNTLDAFEEHHTNYAEMITKELTESTKVQCKLYNNANEKIANMQTLCKNSFVDANALSEKYAKILSDSNADHKALLHKLFGELKEKELEMKTQILCNVTDLVTLNHKQNSLIDTTRESIVSTLQSNSNDLDAHTTDMQNQLKAIIVNSEKSIEELAQMHLQIKNERELVDEEQKVIDEFVKKMQKIKEERLTGLNAMTNMTDKQLQNNQLTINQLEQRSLNAQTFAQKRRTDNDTTVQKLEQQVQATMFCVDSSFALSSAVQAQLENLCQENDKHINECAAAEATNCQQTQNTISDFLVEAKRMRIESDEQLSTACIATQKELCENNERLKCIITTAGSGCSSLQDVVNNYIRAHQEQLGNCAEDVTTFQRSELQTYTPTGATPSKRHFAYPRTLVSTSPHNKIVQRFRQENDWSDLDTTATTIDEECSEDEQQESIQEISDTETVLNSTPIEVAKRSTINNSNPNLFKQMRSSSLTLNQSPRKPLILQNSSAKANKENVS